MEHDLAYFRLKEEVEEFLYEEADLLDQRRFGEWLDRLADDLHCFMPMRRNVPFGSHAERENTRAGQDISWFDGGQVDAVEAGRSDHDRHTLGRGAAVARLPFR